MNLVTLFDMHRRATFAPTTMRRHNNIRCGCGRIRVRNTECPHCSKLAAVPIRPELPEYKPFNEAELAIIDNIGRAVAENRTGQKS